MCGSLPRSRCRRWCRAACTAASSSRCGMAGGRGAHRLARWIRLLPSFEGGDGAGVALEPASDFATEEIIDPVAGTVSLADLIPQLEGSLVVTLGVDDFELAIWPAEQGSPDRINIGDATPSDGYTFPPVAWDATSSRYAFVRTLDADETVLYVGTDTGFTPLVPRRDTIRLACNRAWRTRLERDSWRWSDAAAVHGGCDRVSAAGSRCDSACDPTARWLGRRGLHTELQGPRVGNALDSADRRFRCGDRACRGDPGGIGTGRLNASHETGSQGRPLLCGRPGPDGDRCSRLGSKGCVGQGEARGVGHGRSDRVHDLSAARKRLETRDLDRGRSATVDPGSAWQGVGCRLEPGWPLCGDARIRQP